MRRILVAPDASTRLSAAREWIEARAADAELLVVAPTWVAADDLVRAAIGPRGARFGIVRLTLDRLAARLALPSLARAARVPATALSSIAVAARAVHQLIAENRLSYFAPVASRPGFARAVAATLDELRMNRVESVRIRALPRGGADLALLAERFERELAAVGGADRAIVYEAAVAAATAEDAAGPIGLPLLLADVAPASDCEAMLVQALAKRAPDVLATAAAGDQRTISALERVLDGRAEHAAASGPGTSLGALQRHLFEDSAPPPAPLDDTVLLRNLPGEARECVEIARTILREAERGVAFDRIAILVRSVGEYRPYLEEALRRAEIPAYLAHGTTRPDPAGRALLALLGCKADGLSARRFAEYLSLAQVPDAGERAADAWEPPANDLLPAGDPEPAEVPERDAPPVDDPDAEAVIAGRLRAPWRWERLLVDASVIGGKERWARRLAGLEQELRVRRDAAARDDEGRSRSLDRQLHDLAHLRDFALPLVDRLDRLPARVTWGEWLEHLRDLAGATLREPSNAVAVLEELEAMAPVGPVDLDEVMLVLGPRLRDLTVPPARRRYGAVFVGPADGARGLGFDVVFVPGLAERLFPRKIAEDPILLDGERRALGAPLLRMQADRVAAERLALRLAVGAARRRVVLSYPRVDVERARPRVASFYGLEALRAAEGSLPGFGALAERSGSGAQARLGWPAPEDPQDAIDASEFDLAVLSRLIRPGVEPAAGAARYLLEANAHLARSLRARARRWLVRWTPADGFVEADELGREALARHALGARSFSPTALQHFAVCPYRFFLQAIQRLEPREEPIAIEIIDPLTRGAMFHEAQFAVLTHLETERGLPVTPANLEAALAAADAAVEDVDAEYAERLAPAIPRVWEDGVQAIRADLREWLRRAARDVESGWVPHRFELSFGLVDRDRANADPSSVAEPVPLPGGLRLRGAIDLVERHARRGTLRATDHKTGKVRADDDVVVGGGEVLQPVLYALACEHLLDDAVDSGRLYYCTATGDYEERIVPLNDASRAAAQAVIEIVGRALDRGFLPAAPAGDACEWCDYRRVCGPYEKVRTARKKRDALTDLDQLRSMP